MTPNLKDNLTPLGWEVARGWSDESFRIPNTDGKCFIDYYVGGELTPEVLAITIAEPHIVPTLRALLNAFAPETLASVLAEISAERRRQVEVEGFTPDHDDAWREGELRQAAAVYANPRSVSLWPGTWAIAWFKPSTVRRNLIKAAALLIAEIERLDRIERCPS